MAMMISWVMPVNPSHPYLENDPAPSFAPTICAFHLGFSLGDHQAALRRVGRGLRPGAADRSAAGPAHPPRPHPGNERRELPAQAQQGNRRVQSSRRSRGRIGRTVNAVSSCSFNVSTPTNLLPSVITSVVHDHAAPVAQYLGTIDSWPWETQFSRALARLRAISLLA